MPTTLNGTVESLKRAAAESLARAAQHVPAKRGMLALVERRHVAHYINPPRHVERYGYLPGIVSSIDRAGIVKAVRVVGYDRALESGRDWRRCVGVDAQRQVGDPAAVVARLIGQDGRAIEYDDEKAALAAMKAAAGMAPPRRTTLRVVHDVDRPQPATSPAKTASAPPRKPRNGDVRPREYLTEAEVEKLMAAARKRGRYGARDAAMILVAYRHGLRVGELVTLQWSQVHLDTGLLDVRRLKGGTPTTQNIGGVELRALREVKRGQVAGSRYVFTTERGAPFTTNGVHKMMARTGIAAGFDFPVHPHMLRHGTGFKLANDGQDTRAIQLYLGHRQIQHTTRYTELAPGRFNEFWRD